MPIFCWGAVFLFLFALAFVLPAQGINNTKLKLFSSPKVGFLGVVIFSFLTTVSLILYFVTLLL